MLQKRNPNHEKKTKILKIKKIIKQFDKVLKNFKLQDILLPSPTDDVTALEELLTSSTKSQKKTIKISLPIILALKLISGYLLSKSITNWNKISPNQPPVKIEFQYDLEQDLSKYEKCLREILDQFYSEWKKVVTQLTRKKEELRKDAMNKFIKFKVGEISEQEFVEPENASTFQKKLAFCGHFYDPVEEPKSKKLAFGNNLRGMYKALFDDFQPC